MIKFMKLWGKNIELRWKQVLAVSMLAYLFTNAVEGFLSLIEIFTSTPLGLVLLGLLLSLIIYYLILLLVISFLDTMFTKEVK